jgi:predicted nucleotidyltransferase
MLLRFLGVLSTSRRQIAREAARLLYSRVINDYKEAKETAASSLGSKDMPSNYEVAIELDKIAEEIEGSERSERLIKMRKIALEITQVLKNYKPRLIGSVWRGVAYKGSDIDIIIFHEDEIEILRSLENYEVIEVDNSPFIVNGIPHKSVHIWLDVQKLKVEIVIRPLEEEADERCETFGDLKRGLNHRALEKLMKTDPLRRFLPRRRTR